MNKPNKILSKYDAMKQYVKEGGVRCFFCGRSIIFANETHLRAKGEMIRDMQCEACGRQWQDLYVLKAVHKIFRED